MNFTLEKHKAYKIKIICESTKNIDNLTIAVDSKEHKLKDLQCEIIKNDYIIYFYFVNINKKDVQIAICNNLYNIKYSINIYLCDELQSIYNLIKFGEYLQNNKYLYKYSNIVDNNINYEIQDIEYDDNKSLYNRKMTNNLSKKIMSLNKNHEKIKFTANCKTIDKNKHYLFCIVGYCTCENLKPIFFIDNIKYDIKLKRSLTLAAVSNKGFVSKYGITCDKVNSDDFFNISKVCHFEINNENIIFNQPKKYDVVTIIAFLGRHQMMELNIKTLRKQTKKTGIILIGSSEEDTKWASSIANDDVYYLECVNKPLGLKWNVGVKYSKLFNPNAIVILGSDDLLSTNYIEYMYKHITNGIDLVGKSDWNIVALNEFYEASYKGFGLLGAGKIISKRILDELDWSIFDIIRHYSLDSLGTQIISKKGKHMSDNNKNVSILSVKGNFPQKNTLKSILNSQNKKKSILSIEKKDYNKKIKWIYDNFGSIDVRYLL